MRRTHLPPPALRALCLGLFTLSALGLGAQARLVETRVFPLVGTPSSPLAEGEGKLVLVEGYDAEGRLLSIGRAPAEAASGEAAQPTGGQAKPSADPTTTPKAPAKDPREELVFIDLRYDARGRAVELAERKGFGAPSSLTRRIYDGDDRIIEIDRLEKGSLVESLTLDYEGSGGAARALLRDEKGAPKAAARLVFGGGGAAGLTTRLALVDETGADAGGLSLAWDSGGRLVSWETVPAPSAKDAKGAKEASAAKTGAKDAAGEGALPGIAELLFPVWPADGAGIELATRLAFHGKRLGFDALRASGLDDLPFDRPSEGRADFIWDEAGRLLEARYLDAAGTLKGLLSARYDGRGLLVEEDRLEAKAPAAAAGGEAGAAKTPAAAKPEAAGTPSAAKKVSIMNTYRLDPKGAWIGRSSFLRAEEPAIGGLSPLEYRERTTSRPPR